METENTLIAVDDEARRIKEFKALYYQFNARPDSVTKIYKEKVIFKMEDLKNLNRMVTEKLSIHDDPQNVGTTGVVVTTNRHKTYSFDSFETFSSNDWSTNEYVESITLQWDTYIKLLHYENPQRHKLTVKLTSGIKPQEMLGLILSGRIEDMEHLEDQMASVVAQMDFIDQRLCQEFINIVSEWVELLDKIADHKNKFILKLMKKKQLICYYFHYFLFILAVVICILYFNMWSSTLGVEKISEMEMQHLQFVINYICISCLICFFTLSRGRYVARNIYRILDDYGECFLFRITTGDEKEYTRTEQEDQKSAMKVIAHFILSLILNIIYGIIATMIAVKLGIR